MKTPMTETTFRVEYSSNNSGGDWWLKDEDWKALEDAGWDVEWGGMAYCHSKWSFNDHAPNTCPKPSDLVKKLQARADRPDLDTKNEAAITRQKLRELKVECPGHKAAETYEAMLALGDEARWLGCIAKSAYIEVKAYSRELAEGVAEMWWQDVVHKNPSEQGCNCCGRPHDFYARAKDEE